jgi:Cu/Ag efflux protein CusF
MRRLQTLATVSAVLLGLALAVAAAEEGKGATQTKTGIVKKVDVDAKQIVVMVARELTFTVTDATKIVQGDEAKKLADIKVDAKVTVEYTRDGDIRTATKITLVVERDGKQEDKK